MKSKSILTLGVALIFVLGTPAARAETATTTTPDPTVFIQASSQNASTTYRGSSNTLNAIIATSLASTTALISLELVDEDGQKIVQKSWDNVRLSRDKNVSLEYTLPPTRLSPGVYTWKIGIFEPGWKKLIQWNNRVESFTVVTPVTQTLTASSSLRLSGVWQLSNAIRSGSTNYFNAEFGSGSELAVNYVEINLFNENDELVSSRAWDYVTAYPRETVSKTLTTPPLPPGTYHWSIGVYSPERKNLYTWYESPLTFSVRD